MFCPCDYGEIGLSGHGIRLQYLPQISQLCFLNYPSLLSFPPLPPLSLHHHYLSSLPPSSLPIYLSSLPLSLPTLSPLPPSLPILSPSIITTYPLSSPSIIITYPPSSPSITTYPLSFLPLSLLTFPSLFLHSLLSLHHYLPSCCPPLFRWLVLTMDQMKQIPPRYLLHPAARSVLGLTCIWTSLLPVPLYFFPNSFLLITHA